MGVGHLSHPVPLLTWARSVPPRAKPGRKAAANKTSSQKAFRERKQEQVPSLRRQDLAKESLRYLTELEDKVKRYELMDGEKASLYQQQAQSLRKENAQLKMLVATLYKEIAELKQSKASLAVLQEQAARLAVPKEEPTEDDFQESQEPPSKKAAVDAEPVPSGPPSPLPEPELDLPSIDATGHRISCGGCVSEKDCLCNDPSLALRSTPVYSVPLTRRVRRDSLPHKPVWQIRKQSDQPGPLLLAQQFSQALESSVCRNSPCATCPYRNACQTDQNFAAPKSPADIADIENAVNSSDAWRELSAHPNIGAANLTMLAEVVSHHTKCEGREIDTQGSRRRLAIEKQALLDAKALLDRVNPTA